MSEEIKIKEAALNSVASSIIDTCVISMGKMKRE